MNADNIAARTTTSRLRAWLIFGVLAALASAPDGRATVGRQEYTQVHMGMPVRVTVYAADTVAVRQAISAAFARIAALDAVMSDYRADSELRRLEMRTGEPVRVSDELFAVIRRATDIARASDGAFDPTVAPLVALWREARQTRQLPPPGRVSAARTLVGWRGIALDPERRTIQLMARGMRLDLGGIAKGYILQEALATLRTYGLSRALVEAGGDMVVGDAPPDRGGWRVEVPGASRQFAERAASLTNAALATSGPTSQYVEIDGTRYSHVIDPRTGLGLTTRRLAYVIAEEAATADGLATALVVIESGRHAQLLARFRSAAASVVGDP
jgi:thiamine biosynthesis lipoprotein